MNNAGLEALAGRSGTSPAKASSPALVFFTIHYPLIRTALTDAIPSMGSICGFHTDFGTTKLFTPVLQDNIF
jgi:hypothetical protein